MTEKVLTMNQYIKMKHEFLSKISPYSELSLSSYSDAEVCTEVRSFVSKENPELKWTEALVLSSKDCLLSVEGKEAVPTKLKLLETRVNISTDLETSYVYYEQAR